MDGFLICSMPYFFQLAEEFFGRPDKDILQDRFKNKNLDKETWMALGAVCGSPELIQFAEKEEGEIQMVTGLKMLFDKERNEGARETCEKVALLMLKKSYPEEEIIDISQLTKEELDGLKKHL